MENSSEKLFYTLITGATGGIGRAFAETLAAKGQNLFLTGRSADKLNALKEELSSKYPSLRLIVFACDLTDERSRAEMYKTIDAQGVVFDRLCNVAGADIQKAFEKYTEKKIVFQCRVNLEATLSVTRFVLSRRADALEIVTISSMSGVYPMPYFALYSATKSALVSFFSSLRSELKGSGVKITTVLPGGVYTRPDIVKDIEGQGLWGKMSAKTPEYIAQKSLQAVRRNRKQLIPGFWNKFLATVPKIVPQNWRMRFIARRWRNLEKDAF
ncbi:SDR family NAD(P)-dependent oxidoreductase [Candidatus Borkfalkia ceftriaxoniphila]|nr:SDR family NAD(P)-dependent oxidoreductase [Candidatus Borkfalkia ceftriaxoniphila]